MSGVLSAPPGIPQSAGGARRLPYRLSIRRLAVKAGHMSPWRSSSRVIARREAPWRSKPAGLDCRAAAGLAMTMMGALRRW
jgi:hypothetical protein